MKYKQKMRENEFLYKMAVMNQSGQPDIFKPDTKSEGLSV